jgi:hypothetical protein
VHGYDRKAVLPPLSQQQRKIAAAPFPEAEIVADDKVAYGKASRQDAFDELLGGQRGQLVVEATDMDAVDPAFGEQLEFVAQTGQTRRRLIRREQLARMRLEGEHGRRQRKFARLGRQFGKQRTMAPVYAIEIADGQHRGRRGPLGNTAKNQHGVEAAGKAADYIKLSLRDLHRQGLSGRLRDVIQSSRASFDFASGGFFAK